MASRRWPSAIVESTNATSASGPRWPMAAFIAPMTCRASLPGRVKPAIPHTGQLPLIRFHPRTGRMLHDRLHLVGRLAASFEIDAHLNLRHDSEQDEQNARDADGGGEQR